MPRIICMSPDRNDSWYMRPRDIKDEDSVWMSGLWRVLKSMDSGNNDYKLVYLDNKGWKISVTETPWIPPTT